MRRPLVFLIFLATLGFFAALWLTRPKNIPSPTSPAVEPERKPSALSTTQPNPSTPVGTPQVRDLPRHESHFGIKPGQSRNPGLAARPVQGNFLLNGRRHSVLAARAIPRTFYQGPEDAVLAQVSGFVILPDEPATVPPQDVMIGETQRPVLWNQNKRRAEIVSGTLIVTLKNFASAPTIGRRYGLSILMADENIKTVYYKMPSGFSVFAGERALRVDPEIDRVEIELIHGGVRAR
jgi:hypothetical protein